MPFSLRLALEVPALVGRLLLPANQSNLTIKNEKNNDKKYAKKINHIILQKKQYWWKATCEGYELVSKCQRQQ